MASQPKSGMSPVQHCVSGALGPLLRGQPLSSGKLRFAWRAAVGPAVDRVTTVELQRNGELDVTAADNRWSRELRRLSPLILPRLQALLGPDVVTKVTVRRK